MLHEHFYLTKIPASDRYDMGSNIYIMGIGLVGVLPHIPNLDTWILLEVL